MPGSPGRVYCFNKYPFSRTAPGPMVPFPGLVTNLSIRFTSMAAVGPSCILLNEDNTSRVYISGESLVALFDDVSPPRMDPHILSIVDGLLHLRRAASNSGSIIQDTLGLDRISMLAATDLDADGLVDAVIVAPSDVLNPHGTQSLFWMSSVRLGTGQAPPMANTSLLYRLPAGFRAGHIIVGDFDGDGRASDVAVVSGTGSTVPEQVILLLTSDLAAPVHLLLADMVVDDLAMASVAVDQRQPKIARAPGLAAPGHDSLLVAHGSRVWLVPGPVRPVGGRPSDLGLLEAHGAGLLPDFPTHSDVWWSVATGDFDGDGHLDVALAHGSMGGKVLLLSQVAASPNCLCGPGARCLHEGFFDQPTCQCLDPNADPGTDFAPCEFCRPGFFRASAASLCQACHASCASCTGPTAGDCRSCPQGVLLQGGACVVSPTAPVTVTRAPPGTQAFYEATPAGGFPIPGSGFTSARAFWLAAPFQLGVDTAEAHMRIRISFMTNPSPEGVSFFSMWSSTGMVAFQDTPLQGGLKAVDHVMTNLHSQPLAKYNQKIPLVLNGANAMTCVRSNLAGLCQRIQQNDGMSVDHLTVGRLVGEPGPDAVMRVYNGPSFGNRQISNSTFTAVHWAAVDNDFGIETMVLLNDVTPGGWSPGQPNARCELLWFPFQAFDVDPVGALPAEVLLADVPCGRLIPVLSGPGAGPRPGFLLVPFMPDPSTGAVVLLLRNVATGARFRPDFPAPVPILTAGDLGYTTSTPGLGRLEAVADPLVMAPGRARLFLRTGIWLHLVDVRFDEESVLGDGRPGHGVVVTHQPAVPRHSFDRFAGGPVTMVAVNVQETGHSALALFSHLTHSGAVFRQGGAENGCGCGLLGRCVWQDNWLEGSICRLGFPGPGAATADSQPECVPQATGLLVRDLCQCLDGSPVDENHPSGDLCGGCGPGSGGSDPPIQVTGLAAERAERAGRPPGHPSQPERRVAAPDAGPSPDWPGPAARSQSATCAACSVEGCLVCQGVQCMECHLGLVLTESGRCAGRCDVADAPVVDRRKCDARGPADTWIPAQHVPLHPAWAGMEALQISRLRVAHSSEGDALPLLSSANFLHLGYTRAEDGQREHWMVSVGQLLQDGRPAEPRAVRPSEALAFMRIYCDGAAAGGSQAAGVAAVGLAAASRTRATGLPPGRPLLLPWGRPSDRPAIGHSAGRSTVQAGATATGAGRPVTWDTVPVEHISAFSQAVNLPWLGGLTAEPPAGEAIRPPGTGSFPPGLAKQAVSHVSGVTPFLLAVEAGPPSALGATHPVSVCTITGQPIGAQSHILVSRHSGLDLSDAPVDMMSTCLVATLAMPYPAEEVFLEPAALAAGLGLLAMGFVRVPPAALPGTRQDIHLLMVEGMPLLDRSPLQGCEYVLVEASPRGPGSLPHYQQTSNMANLTGMGQMLQLASIRDLIPWHPVEQPGLLWMQDAKSCIWPLDPGDRHITNVVLSLSLVDFASQAVLLRADGLPDSIVLVDLECIRLNVCQQFSDPSAGSGSGSARTTDAAGPGGSVTGQGSDSSHGSHGSATRNGYGCPMSVMESDPITGDVQLQTHDVDADGLMDYVLVHRDTGRVVFFLAQIGARGAFRRVVVLPGRMAAATGGSLPPPPDILVADVDQDGHMDVVVVDRSADGREASLTVYGRADQTEAWCPPGVEFDPVAGRCVCPGAGRFINPATGKCQCVEHAVPAGPGAVDCICPAGMQAALSACVCQPGLLPVADEATSRAISPPRCEACHGSCATCSATRPGLCAGCPAGRLLQAGACVAACSPGFGPSADGRRTPLGGSCAECDESCTACTGPGSGQCTACAPTAPQLWGGACLGVCPGGTFPETGSSMSLDTCLPCAPYCLGCGGPTGAQCTRCIEGLVLHPVHGCVSSCGRGMVLLGNQCVACSPECRHCEGSPEHCTQCPEGMLLGTTAGTCVPSCGQQEFADLATPSLARCVACHADCVSCERGPGSEHCTVCRPELAFLDLKPENVFVRPDPADPSRLQPVIGDFGVALVLNRFSVIPTLGDVAAGSLPYAPPETLARLHGLPFALAPPDSSVVSLLKVDIYSLGVLLFSLVAAARPWSDAPQADILRAVLDGKRPDVAPGTGAPVWLTDAASAAPWLAAFQQAYRQAWAADPRERPGAAALAATLAALAASS
ncbi:hypothetical protein H696_06082 [Fonticula alba]|uniref:Protein kinase domain-containing protein n=1 Tax=Fonticula alba TaxID=691883 RepID=A0A058Z1R7_FONAL|nr:hypothetical protein H696_06082 [Fonticula alba]KCV67447.1 hypothetical protein H696_06082 [Fonticula alba]|eukprot:XP_009498123.1 hypothetical protein H696_06082 [Fonticula alba]